MSPNSPRGFTSDATSSHPPMFGRLLLSSTVFALFWASANGGSVAAQAPAITSATVGKNVVTGMPGAPKRYQIYASATVSNLPNSVQSVDLVYFFQKRTRASTANPVSPAGPWLRLSLLQNSDDDPANSARCARHPRARSRAANPGRFPPSGRSHVSFVIGFLRGLGARDSIRRPGEDLRSSSEAARQGRNEKSPHSAEITFR